MKTAVMQPYFLPYIGYFQLINAVDTFVILDDVNFIMRGRINRNNILLNNNAHLFSIPLEKPSQNKLINQTKIVSDEKWKKNLLKTIHMAYQKAPMFDEIDSFIEDIINFDETDLTKYILNSFTKIADFYDIKTKFLISSEIKKDNSLKAEERIIEICKKLNTKTYINLPGGRSLYHKENFEKARINLRFINPNLGNIIYRQFGEDFVPALSFLDIIMFNSKEKIKEFLQKYSLLI